MIDFEVVSVFKTDDINMLPYQLIRRIDRKWQELKADYNERGICIDKQFVRNVFDDVRDHFIRVGDWEQLFFMLLNKDILWEHYEKILQHYTKTGKDLTENDRDLNDAQA